MGELNATPGPWALQPEPYRHFWQVVANYRLVGSSPTGGTKNTPEQLAEYKANAQLIAAAPDLYEALENALEVMEDGPPSYAMEMARAALSKAKGQQVL